MQIDVEEGNHEEAEQEASIQILQAVAGEMLHKEAEKRQMRRTMMMI